MCLQKMDDGKHCSTKVEEMICIIFLTDILRESSMYVNSEIFYDEREHHILKFGPSYTVIVHKAASFISCNPFASAQLYIAPIEVKNAHSFNQIYSMSSSKLISYWRP